MCQRSLGFVRGVFPCYRNLRCVRGVGLSEECFRVIDLRCVRGVWDLSELCFCVIGI